MNKLTIIGNLTRDPELRTTQTGLNVCTFTVAVNRRGRDGDADYFRVSAWRELGDNCKKYLSKGRKVCVIGAVSVSTYQRQDGGYAAQMEVLANEVEFLTASAAYEESKGKQADVPPPRVPEGYAEVTDSELPF